MRPPLRRYSLLAMLREARRGHGGWPPAWRKAVLQSAYDIVIVGGGASALALAAAMARQPGALRVAVLADGPLMGGPGGAAVLRGVRGTAPHTALLAESQRLFAGLSRELNFNIGLSRRGLLDLVAGPAALDVAEQAAATAAERGVKAWLVPPREVRVLAPLLGADAAPYGALWQPDAGLADGDAVVWGYARLASAHGADIVENRAADALLLQGGRIAGIQVGERTVRAGTVVLTSTAAPRLLAEAGIAAPLAAAPRRTLVCEPARPLLDVAVSGEALGGTVRQSAAGEVVFEAAEDEAGGWAGARAAAGRLVAQFPGLGCLRVVRTEAVADLASPDGAPLVGQLGVPGLWASLGWGEDEMAAAPALGLALAHSIAQDRAHPLIAALAPSRFAAADALP